MAGNSRRRGATAPRRKKGATTQVVSAQGVAGQGPTRRRASAPGKRLPRGGRGTRRRGATRPTGPQGPPGRAEWCGRNASGGHAAGVRRWRLRATGWTPTTGSGRH